MPQLHLLAGLDRKRRDAFGIDLRHEHLDALGDGDAILVELILPEETVHQRALQLHLGREALAPRALVRECANELVELDHAWPPLRLIVAGERVAGEQARL